MPVHVDLIRHAETEANAAGLWQGKGDTALSSTGHDQLRRLAARLSARPYDLVVSSDLGRAVATAVAVGDAEPDPRWREGNIGAWEGLTRAEVVARYPDELAALARGDDVALGGGETLAEISARTREALDHLVGRLVDGQRAAVVSHGGVLATMVSSILGIDRYPRRRVLGRVANTAVTSIMFDGGPGSLAVYNDVAHLDGDPEPPGFPVFTLIRHGETEANAAGRWQGITDGQLSELGRRQAEELAGRVNGLSAIYSSTLSRARATAAAIARRQGVPHREHPGFHEMGFGGWEDQAPETIAERWPEGWQRIYVEGHDLPRGETGETYAGAARRIAAALADVAARHPDGGVGVVTHGGAARAYVTDFLGVPFAERRRLGQLRNTGTARIGLGGDGPRLVDYNVAPHLDS